MGVSKNRGSPKSMAYKDDLGFFPYFWKHPHRSYRYLPGTCEDITPVKTNLGHFFGAKLSTTTVDGSEIQRENHRLDGAKTL